MVERDRLLPEHVVAQRLGLSRKTLQGWRRKGEGPRWIRVGSRTVRYPESALREYIEAGAQATA